MDTFWNTFGELGWSKRMQIRGWMYRMSRILRRSMAGFSFIEAVEVLSFAVSTRGICDRFDFILFRIYIFVLFEPLSNVIAKEIRTSLILKFLYKRVKNNFQFILYSSMLEWYSGWLLSTKDWLKFKTRKIVFSKDTVAVSILFPELAVNLPWHFLIQPSRDSHDIWDAFAPTACPDAKFYTVILYRRWNHDMNTLLLSKIVYWFDVGKHHLKNIKFREIYTL